MGQIILIASSSNGEDTIWVQMLVLVVLATLLGIWGLIKTRANKLKEQEQDYALSGRNPPVRFGQPIKLLRGLKGKVAGIFVKTAQTGVVGEERKSGFYGRRRGVPGELRHKPAGEKDLKSGMELLEPSFLLRVVESTESNDKNDVMMRKLSFNELLRREELDRVAGNALKVYAVNEGSVYGKDIQCEAMKELAKRTKLRSE